MFHPHRRQSKNRSFATTRAGWRAAPPRSSQCRRRGPSAPTRPNEGQGPEIAMLRTLHHVAELGPTQRAAAQIVVALQEREPHLGFLGIAAADRLDSHVAQLAQGTTEFSKLRCNGIAPERSKP